VPDAGREDWRRLAKSFCSRCSLLAASGRKLVAGTCSVTPNLLLSGSSLHFRIDCSAAVKASKLEAIIEAYAAAELVLRLDIAEAGLARGVNSLGGEYIKGTACVLLNMRRLAASAAAPAAAAATFEAAVEAAAAASAAAEAPAGGACRRRHLGARSQRLGRLNGPHLPRRRRRRLPGECCLPDGRPLRALP